MVQKRNKIVAIIEARMSSSRLPGKVLLHGVGKPMIGHLIERLKSIKLIDEVVVATTTNKDDQKIIDYCSTLDVRCFQGSEMNVMDRVYRAATFFKADTIVEITGDCPLLDPKICNNVLETYLSSNKDYANNNTIRSFPDGMDTRVFSTKVLKKSMSMTTSKLDQEHVSLHIKNNPKIFSFVNVVAPEALYWPELGLTLDEESDYVVIKKIIEALYKNNKLFDCYDIIKFLKSNIDIVELNKNVIRKGDT